MREKENSLEEKIKYMSEKFLEKSKDREILVISHFDTDGITSATIMIKTLKKLDRTFSVKIVKSLDKEFIENLPKDKIILFLDLASGSLDHIRDSYLKEVFIIDHHEITQEIPEKIEIVNPELYNNQKLSGSSLTYLFCREINPEIKDSAKLAILGMIGDMMEKEIDSLNNEILEDGEIIIKKGLMIYPSTRPLNRVLEYSSNPYIPGVTGNIKGVLELLRDAGLAPKNGKYKSLLELTNEEMENLFTAITLRNPEKKSLKLLGNIFLIKMFNKLEDARELSAKINACARIGETSTAILFCMENPKIKKRVESIHTKYKQHIISGLKFISETEKIKGEDFIIINAKNKIKDTIIGVLASILSTSSLYEEGTAIIAMAYDREKIKISARNSGKNGRNVREVLAKVIAKTGGEVGGHPVAAGCIISQEKEKEFIEDLKKNLEIQTIKV